MKTSNISFSFKSLQGDGHAFYVHKRCKEESSWNKTHFHPSVRYIGIERKRTKVRKNKPRISFFFLPSFLGERKGIGKGEIGVTMGPLHIQCTFAFSYTYWQKNSQQKNVKKDNGEENEERQTTILFFPNRFCS